MLRTIKRWVRRWNYWWSDARHEEFIAYTRAITDICDVPLTTIRSQISYLSDRYAFHHSDIAYNVAIMMAFEDKTFVDALDVIRAELEARDNA